MVWDLVWNSILVTTVDSCKELGSVPVNRGSKRDGSHSYEENSLSARLKSIL